MNQNYEDAEQDYSFQVYVRLVTETYDADEYRLPLWLPLSLEQKLDMLLHQKISEEAEIMQFLIDEEQGCGLKVQAASLKKYEDVDKKLEQAVDGLIFEKHMLLTRMQAINTAKDRCQSHLESLKSDDTDIKKYAEWLIRKLETAQEEEKRMRSKIKKEQGNKENNLKMIAR